MQQARFFNKVAIVFVILGILGLVVFLYSVQTSGMLFGSKIIPEYAVMVGTFIGGTIGAIWSLSGVFFFYSALLYQKEEISLTNASKRSLEEAYNDQKNYFQQDKFQYQFFELNKIFTDAKQSLHKLERINPESLTCGIQNSKMEIIGADAHQYIKILKIEIDHERCNCLPDTSKNINSFSDDKLSAYSAFCETFYAIVHRTKKYSDNESSPDLKKFYDQYEALVIIPLLKNEVYCITYFALQGYQSLRLLDLLCKSKSWAYKINQFRESEPDLYFIWKFIKEERKNL